MGKYNFDEIIDRRGTSCNKWEYNIPEDVIPMWVADMDFAAAPEIREAMQKRLDHPVYGYTHHSKELKDAIVSWVGRRYHWDIQSEWLGFSPGVVPALVMSLLSLTTPGDRIVIMTPVYHPFYSSIEENGRVIINHQLDCDENGYYSINFERLEAQIDNRCKAIMMCNPHNPAGRVWTKEELIKVAEICKRNNTLLVSDEIHGDIVYGEKKSFWKLLKSPNAMSCILFPMRSMQISYMAENTILRWHLYRTMLWNIQSQLLHRVKPLMLPVFVNLMLLFRTRNYIMRMTQPIMRLIWGITFSV